MAETDVNNETAAPERDDTRKGGFDGTTAALLGTAAAGVALGIAAMIGRKFAVQAPTMLAGDWDKALALEHRMSTLR